MARTAQQNSEWWLDMAARYDREAAQAKTPTAQHHWQNRAVLARAAATKSFLSPPASGEALMS